MSNQFEKSIPILPVYDVEETANFYKEKFGFEIEILWNNPHYAVVRREGASVEFGEGRPDHVGSGVCYIVVENADDIYNEYKKRGIEFVDELRDRDYGNRDFRLRDNNGNMLIIGNRLNKQEELLSRGNVA
jgi:uncharacterized glyoxalase superfamily protein PhnB